MRVHLKTLGCRLNEAELESWARQFQSSGCALVASPEQADVIVLNSCAVTGDAARKSRHYIRRLRRENPRAKLVVSGCWATLHPNEAAQQLDVDLVVGNADKHRLVELTVMALASPRNMTNRQDNRFARRSRPKGATQDVSHERALAMTVSLTPALSGTLTQPSPRGRGGFEIWERVSKVAATFTLTQQEVRPEAMPLLSTGPGEAALFRLGRQRAFIKVQDGCRHRCTFCIVTVARGAERSRRVAEIVAEVNALYSEGVREVVLTGVHLGGYGADLGLKLDDLLRAVLADTDVPRVRLGSLEPWDLPESFFGLWENPRLMPHLHLPLQSGADSVLRRMARRCKTAGFAALVEEARCCIPDLNVTTDILAGFPGESDAEWKQTLEFVERIAFGHIHIFAYSRREGTRAATLPGPVADAVKKARVRELRQLAARLRREALARRVGRVFPVLWEEQCEPLAEGRVLRFGYTPNYLRAAVAVAVDMPLARMIRPARLTGIAPDDASLRAELTDD
jgi:threonylcarbamoyladenosine tRNA methylthiotransferase MtaB